MHSSRHAQILPSVLDRLLDDQPDNSHGAETMLYELPQVKRSLARDLEALLNTRLAPLQELFDMYPQAHDSMLSFGIPDLSGISLLNPHDRELLREQLRRAIEMHEPRLSRVRVNLDAPREMESATALPRRRGAESTSAPAAGHLRRHPATLLQRIQGTRLTQPDSAPWTSAPCSPASPPPSTKTNACSPSAWATAAWRPSNCCP
ncbi:type VI secretion system baseplate subunit TssE [Chromobacterium haemolyticum]|nr:type VI secretion system baseplate subunit TssE [Chromobacterium haemolyticum]